MSTQYKENYFSLNNPSTPKDKSQNNTDKIVKPNIDHLIKRILIERRQNDRKSMALGFLVLSVILIFIFLKTI
jgi:hypothetical protein|tara:strand:- start:747 stop:965 length:219 start_codon:yes stop_codon:yes gene_type:complete